jgi:hypothetical protein
MAKKAKRPSEKATVSQAAKQSIPLSASFKELRDRANRGDPAAQAELQRALDANPDIWRSLGDLAAHAQRAFVRVLAPNDFLFAESIRRRAGELRRELAGAFPTPLELLAVERVVAAWLQVQHVEMQIGLADGQVATAKFWLQRQLQASRLYHSATKSLLLIRELLPPATEPAALAAHGTAVAKLNGNSRFVVGGNANASSRRREPAAAPVNRINGVKNCKQREMALA